MDTIQETEAYTVHELTFERCGMAIYGNLYLPKGDRKAWPTAIMGHGFNSSYFFLAPYAAVLAENGVAAYVFDFCGGSINSRSEGDMLEMSVLTEIEDMEAVLKQIKGQPFVDTERLFLIGESQGGLVAALTAVEHPEVKGLGLLYPAFVIPDDVRKAYPPGTDIPDQGSVFGVTVGRCYFADVRDMDVFQAIGTYEGPVLMIHGTADELVPIAYSERALEVYPNGSLVSLDGAGHGFWGVNRQKAAAELSAFVQRVCGEKS